MKLNKSCLNEHLAGVNYPRYDVLKVWQETKENPVWLLLDMMF